MLKKISTGLVLSAALLLGGVFNTSVDASSNANQSKAQTYKVYYSINGNWDSNFSWDKLNNYFNNFQKNNWKKVNWDAKQEKPKVEQPKAEQPKVEQPKEEQPKAEQPKEEQVKVEQPKEEQSKEEQPKVEQPAQQAPVEPQAPKQEEQQSQNQSEQLSQFEQEVFDLTNKERVNNGLAALQVDLELSKVAREKSKDMSVKNYFDHNSPTYGSPFDMMKSYGITYSAAGENIAKGQRTPQEVVTAWMNSPGHRANILNGSFTHIGVGFVEQGNHWTQMFIGK